MKRERIFISGVAGFLGSHLADAFLADGHEVVGVDNLVGGYVDNVPRGVEFHEIDCNDLDRLGPHVRGCQVVYHCAAEAYEGLSVFSPHRVTKSIVTASTGMIAAAIAGGVRRFVMCSSMARYGAQQVPFTEDMTPRPQDPYGIGKHASELLLRNLAELHGMEWVIAVPHNIVGPRQKYDDPYRNVAAIFINRMLQGKPPIVYGDGQQKRCFSYVSDDVVPLKQMAFDPACAGEVVNIGPDGEFVTIRELAETIARLLDVRLEVQFTAARPAEVLLANCSADKARRMLGYEPRVSLEDGLRAMIDWIRTRGPRPFQYHLDVEISSDRTPETWKKKLL